MTKMPHKVCFPNFHSDVLSEKRTLFHMPLGAEMWLPGEKLLLLVNSNFPRCKVGVLARVEQVYLLEDLDDILAKLCAPDRTTYLARWDALHPGLPSSEDPLVWRIEFKYERDLDPPEWSLAS